MQVVHDKKALKQVLGAFRAEGKSIGFVPTMGYLHQGHLSLIRKAKAENDVVVVSVFVNPTQFGPNEDLSAYPRDTDGDLAALQSEKTDVAFFPTVEALYPEGYATYVDLDGPITRTLCGRSRPGHFRGVATIVTKLFHMVAPDHAYFGMKDAQQVSVIEKMVHDLDFDLQIVACPTVREADGLAMSSRNSYLNEAQRAQAPKISRALFGVRDLIETGERDAAKLLAFLQKEILEMEGATIDYLSIVDARSLADLEVVTGEVLIAVAVKLGGTRLIDNIRVAV